MVTSILHPTVYNPIRSTSMRWIAKKRAPLPDDRHIFGLWPHARADFLSH
jgi:hypothetical protein